VYQGEEFGMPNPGFTSIDQYRDVEAVNYFNILKEEGVEEEKILEILRSKSRDNGRTPVQWNAEKNAGFTTGEPWIPVGNSYESINAEAALKNEDSIFYHYKKLINLRKEYDVISHGSVQMILEEHNKVFGFTRSYENEMLVVLNNFYGEDTEVILEDELLQGNSRILISNYKESMELGKNISLRPYESVAYIIEK